MQTTDGILKEKDFTTCLSDLMAFLVSADETGPAFGGRTADEALESVRVILGYDKEKFEQLKDIFR